MEGLEGALFEYFTIELLKHFEQSGDGAYEKLELLAFRVGETLFEVHTRKLPRLKEPLEIIKFLCKDFWNHVFQKNIDNLRTNHRGVYVLQDNSFRMFQQVGRSAEEVDKAKLMLAFPCGLIRGALFAVGIKADVRAAIADDKGQLTLPGCKFTLQMHTE
eukprot:m.165428 g.165428  ORF g.165428 m.165428 type:complete len:160 (-) comp15262_c0_seq1:153-632(-)